MNLLGCCRKQETQCCVSYDVLREVLSGSSGDRMALYRAPRAAEGGLSARVDIEIRAVELATGNPVSSWRSCLS